MIPRNITRSHLLQAIHEIDKKGIPSGRHSTKYTLIHNNKSYPPKYLISLANKYANGLELSPNEFSGGAESNVFLTSFGFKIRGESNEQIDGIFTAFVPPKKEKIHRHNDRCSDCKNTIIDLLRNLYGSVKIDHKVDAAAQLEAYKGTSFYTALQKIYNALLEYRGNDNFVRLMNLHRCDIYIPDPGFIVEFDESQHFSEAREIALNHYPNDLRLGFNIDDWKQLCASIRSKDNDPKDRDEQRSWYDTIRDFLPLIKGFQPTVRIHMGSTEWCKYDSVRDAKRFATELGLPLPGKTPISSQKKIGLNVATVVIGTDGRIDDQNRISLLRRVVQMIDKETDVLLLPADFLETSRKANKLFKNTEKIVSTLLREQNLDTVICLGIDGRDGRDQTALSITKKGIIAAARKYHPTAEEDGHIVVANDFFEGEGGYPRTFEINGAILYLAVCYDGFGIRQRKLQNPGVDVVLDLVHGFQPKSEGNSGDVYFARHGFAGAAKQWAVPIFGAAVFFDRPIPPKWPTGVVWDQASLPTGKWKYEFNPLKPTSQVSCEIGNEVAIVRSFSI